MSRKHQMDLYFNFVAVFLGTFTTLGFAFFTLGIEHQNKFEVITGAAMLIVSMIALYLYANVAKKMK
jgi:ABC-type antimicrobial peptide transport system permease subunit